MLSEDMTVTDSLNASKLIEVEPGVTLTIGGNQTTVSGTIVNNGTIKVTSRSQCIWKATTSGNGKLVAANVRSGDEYQTYVDYGCVPEAMMENCQINIVKDLSVRPTVSLPENMQVGRHDHTDRHESDRWCGHCESVSNTHGRMETAASCV